MLKMKTELEKRCGPMKEAGTREVGSRKGATDPPPVIRVVDRCHPVPIIPLQCRVAVILVLGQSFVGTRGFGALATLNT